MGRKPSKLRYSPPALVLALLALMLVAMMAAPGITASGAAPQNFPVSSQAAHPSPMYYIGTTSFNYRSSNYPFFYTDADMTMHGALVNGVNHQFEMRNAPYTAPGSGISMGIRYYQMTLGALLAANKVVRASWPMTADPTSFTVNLLMDPNGNGYGVWSVVPCPGSTPSPAGAVCEQKTGTDNDPAGLGPSATFDPMTSARSIAITGASSFYIVRGACNGMAKTLADLVAGACAGISASTSTEVNALTFIGSGEYAKHQEITIQPDPSDTDSPIYAATAPGGGSPPPPTSTSPPTLPGSFSFLGLQFHDGLVIIPGLVAVLFMALVGYLMGVGPKALLFLAGLEIAAIVGIALVVNAGTFEFAAVAASFVVVNMFIGEVMRVGLKKSLVLSAVGALAFLVLVFFNVGTLLF